MALNYVNRTTFQSARNGTTSHAISFAAATAGNLLVAVLAGGVTITMPGWTLVNSSVAWDGLYIWKKTAAAAESSVVATANAPDYPIGGIVYEFLFGTTVDSSVTSGGSLQAYDAANPTETPATGKTGIAVVAYVCGGIGETWTSVTWPGATEDFDLTTPYAGNDGYLVSGAWIDGTGAAFAPSSIPNSGTFTGRQSMSMILTVATVVPLSAPTNLHTTAVAATSVGLAWNAVTGAAGYKVATTTNFTLGEFSIYGSQIIDPAGQPYVPVGANINGPDSWWNDPTIGMSYLSQMWHWNTVRLSTCWVGGCPGAGGWDWHVNDDLAGIISEYTSAHIVVMIALHQFTGAGSLTVDQAATLVSWWTGLAQQFKDNPYVWFNVINEPVQGGLDSLAAWTAMTEPSVQAIRATGARNIVVVDGSAFGQEANDWGLGDIPYENSAILALCPAMQATYGNILPSVHVYGEWGGGSTRGTTQQLNDRLSHYIDQVHSANLPLVIGETGDQPDPLADPWAFQGQWYGTDTAFNVAPGQGVGILWWHSSGGSGYYLINGSGWEAIDSATNPTNLSYFGQRLFDYATSVNP